MYATAVTSTTPATVARDDSHDVLVEQYLPLVKRIAYHLINRLPPSLQLDDLKQAGVIGLLEAARNYDPRQGASFETYAGIRIRGAMLDEMRRTDWTPRSVHRKARTVSEVVREIENREGRDARDSEVADALGMSLEAYHGILQDVATSRVFRLEDLGLDECNDADAEAGPLSSLQDAHFCEALGGAISGLPERERMVVRMYYEHGMVLREIGQTLGVSESRVCQIHGKALVRLRARMAEWLEDEA